MQHFAAFATLLATSSTGCLEFHQGALPGAPKGATYADVDGAHIRYLDEGPKDATATPVVLIHGFASALENWALVQPTLKKTRRVLSLDLKGFGWSDRPAGDYSPEAEAKIVLDLMLQRGIEKADVVGHSWGASVALAVALASPSRVRSLALYDAWVYEEQLPSFFLWSRAQGLGETLFALFYKERADERVEYAFFDKEKWVTQPFVDEIERALQRPGTLAASLAAVRGQRYAHLQERYRTIKQPTLLLWGREDQVTLLPFGERLSHDLPDARLDVYPRCGHFPMLEAVAASTRDLIAFLDEER
jgi:pimeloyl-ACP methyl ester carboxylesterase